VLDEEMPPIIDAVRTIIDELTQHTAASASTVAWLTAEPTSADAGGAG